MAELSFHFGAKDKQQIFLGDSKGKPSRYILTNS